MKSRNYKFSANADSPRDAAVAIKFGAEGIGLCRTEHMFFEGDRIEYVRQMILSDTVEERIKALDELYKFQVEDFRRNLSCDGWITGNSTFIRSTSS